MKNLLKISLLVLTTTIAYSGIQTLTLNKDIGRSFDTGVAGFDFVGVIPGLSIVGLLIPNSNITQSKSGCVHTFKAGSSYIVNGSILCSIEQINSDAFYSVLDRNDLNLLANKSLSWEY